MTKVHQVTCCLLVSLVASLLLLPSDPPQTPATHPRSYRHLAGVTYNLIDFGVGGMRR